MLPRTTLLPLLLLLLRIPATTARGGKDDSVSDCAPRCLEANGASNIKTFSCDYFKTNTALVTCINACPADDIDDFLDDLKLPHDCEEDLFPSQKDDNDHDDDDNTQTGTRTPTSLAPTGTGGPEDNNDTPTNTRTVTNVIATPDTNTTLTTTSTGVTSIPTATDKAVTTTVNGTVTSTGTSTQSTSPTASDDSGAGAIFGNPSMVGLIVGGFVAWGFLL